MARLGAAASPAAYRVAVLVLWGLAANAAIACRGLFWDGSSFLVNIIELGEVHDFYTARAHVDWVTQAPVLVAIRLGVRDIHVLATVYSASLFALPVGLYHVALARLRGDGVALAIALVFLLMVWLPASFFIVGEYNATYAAVLAATAVSLVPGRNRLADAVLLVLLGLLSVRSYEAMVYLGPLVAAVILWSWRGETDRWLRGLSVVAALAFLGGAAVAGATLVGYWSHPHFIKVRATSLGFWQNLQVVIPLAGLVLCALAGLVHPPWLRGRGPVAVLGIVAVALVLSPWYRLFDDHSILYPPAHYLARQAAGIAAFGLLAGLWLQVAWRSPPRVLAVLREPAVARRLTATLAVLLVAAAVPDIALTNLWTEYVARLRGLVDHERGIVQARDLPVLDWPDKLFAQDWTLPAMSALVSRTPGRAYVLADNDYRSNPPFDPACGTLPRLSGYGWGR